MALKDVLKKIGGVVTSVASAVVKNIPIVGTAASSVLANVSQKLLASPTPIKESAAQLATNAPAAISTPIKESSVALLVGAAPVASTPIKQSALDLIGKTTANLTTKSVPAVTSPLASQAKPASPAKQIEDLITGGGKVKQNFTILYVIVGVIAMILFGVFFLKPRRR